MADHSSADVEAALRRAQNEIVEGLRSLGMSLAVGTSATRFRKGNEEAAAAALAGLTQEERDDLHRWARWLLGFTEGD